MVDTPPEGPVDAWPVAASALEPGQRFGQYELVRPLGAGGMATVWLVEHVDFRSFHALKVLLHPTAATRARLLREGSAQARLRHDHIVPVTAWIEVNGSPGLVMDYIDGPSMRAWLQSRKRPWGTRLQLFRQAAQGVACAHAHGLVHRDIKPENVLLQTLDGQLRARVTDFGLVKSQDDDGGPKTREGSTMGTPWYMAPEQVRNAAEADERSDIFSLTAMLYEIITGDPPHGLEGLIPTYERAKAGERAPLEQLIGGEVPDALQALIDRGLAAHPEDRFPSVLALIEALDEATRGWSADRDFANLVPAAKPPPTTLVAATDAPDLMAAPTPTPAPVRAASGAGWIAAGVAAAVVILGSIGLALVLGLSVAAGWPSTDTPAADLPPTRVASPAGALPRCTEGAGGRIGFAKTSALQPILKGRPWQLAKTRTVFSGSPSSGLGPPLCVLPAGSRVQVKDKPIRSGRATWVPVDGEALQLP